jgi:hypothetical protein
MNFYAQSIQADLQHSRDAAKLHSAVALQFASLARLELTRTNLNAPSISKSSLPGLTNEAGSRFVWRLFSNCLQTWPDDAC